MSDAHPDSSHLVRALPCVGSRAADVSTQREITIRRQVIRLGGGTIAVRRFQVD